MSGRPVALLLPGQGAQHTGMATGLYGREPVFTETMDDFFALLGPEGTRLRDDWLTDRPRVPIEEASRAQPLLYATGHALGRALRQHGVTPAVLLGHSVGELAAAALAGVLSPAGAARVNLARTDALAGETAGGMLAVAATPERLAPFVDVPLPEPGRSFAGAPERAVVVGAVNGPMQTVLAGPDPELSGVERELLDAGIPCRRVGARQPFHAPAMARAAERYARAFAAEPLSPPTTTVWSTRTARPVTPRQARDPRFWAGQLVSPVLYWPALDALLSRGSYTLVDTGPGQLLSTAARRHPAVRRGDSEVVSMLPARPTGNAADSWRTGLERLAALAHSSSVTP
ncbi:acyltransferase domain-containing protein [Actinomadura kijaniata]|uniref:acyltransferase domain-containing protein n=1 Tax=Actinomadura kijaniata TaxID=46161 RepID=UPI003F1B3B49